MAFLIEAKFIFLIDFDINCEGYDQTDGKIKRDNQKEIKECDRSEVGGHTKDNSEIKIYDY